MWVAHADANGRRLRPGEGNAGYNTYALVSTAGWKKGTYYIAVQAVDANGLGGAWSEEVTFEYTGLVASVTLSADYMNLLDTLIVTTSLPYDETLDYAWNFGDGGRSVGREGNRWQVVFDHAGRKTLGLTLTDADGLMAVATEQTVDVYPIAWEVDSLTHDRVQYSDGLYLDLDGNGTLDLVGQSTVLLSTARCRTSRACSRTRRTTTVSPRLDASTIPTSTPPLMGITLSPSIITWTASPTSWARPTRATSSSTSAASTSTLTPKRSACSR